ncbi:MAG: thioredoxin [Mycoplasmataceae bacterium]|nr:thioredoxin [Mycoplasmataceae bacterium]
MNIKELDSLVQTKKTIVIDFFATWCGPCQMLSPIIHELEKEMPEVKFIKINVDEDIALAQKFNVSSIPTVVLFKNGKMVDSFLGFRPKEAIKSWINK